MVHSISSDSLALAWCSIDIGSECKLLVFISKWRLDQKHKTAWSRPNIEDHMWLKIGISFGPSIPKCYYLQILSSHLFFCMKFQFLKPAWVLGNPSHERWWETFPHICLTRRAMCPAHDQGRRQPNLDYQLLLQESMHSTNNCEQTMFHTLSILVLIFSTKFVDVFWDIWTYTYDQTLVEVTAYLFHP